MLMIREEKKEVVGVGKMGLMERREGKMWKEVEGEGVGEGGGLFGDDGRVGRKMGVEREKEIVELGRVDVGGGEWVDGRGGGRGW